MLEIELVSPIQNIIEALNSETLDKFSVITGDNGSGKTKLLSGIKSGQVQIKYEGRVINPKLISLVDRANIDQPIDIDHADYVVWESTGVDNSSYFSRWSKFQDTERSHLFSIAKKNRVKNINCLDPDSIKDIDLKKKYQPYLEYTRDRVRHLRGQGAPVRYFLDLIENMTEAKKVNPYFIYGYKSIVADASLEGIENTIILHSMHAKPQNSTIRNDENASRNQEWQERGQGDLLPALNLIIYNYCKRYKDNLHKFALHKNQDENHPNAISKETFKKRFPEPWVIINKFLEHFDDFKYQIDSINLEDFSVDTKINMVLKDKEKGTIVPFDGLSSGEHTIFMSR